MSAAQLVVGRPYFTVVRDVGTGIPIITTYTFLGKDPAGVPQDEAGPRYYFRCLPPFQDAEAGEQLEASAATWAKIFPGAFDGWGESWPTPFAEEGLLAFLTLEGLIAELEASRTRVAR